MHFADGWYLSHCYGVKIHQCKHQILKTKSTVDSIPGENIMRYRQAIHYKTRRYELPLPAGNLILWRVTRTFIEIYPGCS